MLMVKSVEASLEPNPTRDPAARWDAYVSVPVPDALAAEFTSRGVVFSGYDGRPAWIRAERR